MKQVLLDGRGQVQVVEVPAPKPERGQVLVSTAYSLISSGTELATLQHQSSGLLKRAMEKPGLAKDLAKRVVMEGPLATKDAVEERLSRWNPIGYSLAGTVMDVGEGVEGLRVTDRVACSGAGHAHHAEVVAVPFRLAVPIPERVAFREAAFAPVAAIAMQAVRRSNAAIGETVVVIGLGLVGLLACQLLRKAGCRVIGYDLDPARCELGVGLGCEATAEEEARLDELVKQHTSGFGADAVLICAASVSNAPVNLGVALARERGRAVVVGNVGMELDREAMYRKEIDLVMSRSLGPGRYDRRYEVEGHDYPAAYVRWTEARNMEACLGLMEKGGLDIASLVSFEATVENAVEAYAKLSGDGKPVAVLLRYEKNLSGTPSTPPVRKVPVKAPGPLAGRIGAGLIGPGNFARAVHLPALKSSREFVLIGVAARQGHAADHTARHYGASYGTTDPSELFGDQKVQAVWITSTHESHARLTLQALRAGKNVFVEKPLALTLEDCHQVVGAAHQSGHVVMVGFNRRFAPASRVASRHFAGVASPKQILYRVRADASPSGHWLDDPARGGGRLLGEGVHFFDWMAWFLKEEPVRVTATSSSGEDNSTVVVEFSGGSVGTLAYTTAGSEALPKERIEVFGGGKSAVVDNFGRVLLGGERGAHKVVQAKGKGYVEQMTAFAAALRGKPFEGPTAQDGLRATACALAALAALRERGPQQVVL
ncbi:MAG: zinc-binding dehydrogenase [SAR202 cluster bacterium]|nr:zinc-binding dehydrogenase [SAR202 cluster bacterium]